MEAAESVFNASGRTKKAPGQKLADGIADLLFSLIIYVVFMLQASIAKNIPLEVLFHEPIFFRAEPFSVPSEGSLKPTNFLRA